MCRKTFAVSASVLLASWAATEARSAPPSSAPPALASARVDRAPAPSASVERFKVYKTQNAWTVLLLDTRTGRLWQAQWTVDSKSLRGILPVSDVTRADGPDGRFSVTLTDNIWNSILLDGQTGRLWQCQFSLQESGRGCMPIDLEDKSVGYFVPDAGQPPK
jgi:hypothetical protein